MACIERYFLLSHGVPHVDEPVRRERHRLRDPQRLAVEGCAQVLWAAQDAPQPLHALEPAGVFDRIFAGLAGEGLAAHCNTLRPMRPHLLLRHMHSSRRHLLALINES